MAIITKEELAAMTDDEKNERRTDYIEDFRICAALWEKWFDELAHDVLVPLYLNNAREHLQMAFSDLRTAAVMA